MVGNSKKDNASNGRISISKNYKEIKALFPNVKFNSQYIYVNNHTNTVKGMRVSAWSKTKDDFLSIQRMLHIHNYSYKILELGPIYPIDENGNKVDMEVYFLKFNLLNSSGENSNGKH